MSGRTVLLVESHRGTGDADAAALAAAGDRVVRCYPDEWQGAARRHPFVCVGVAEGTCPIEQGVDAVLVERAHISPRLSGLEAGALCALRQGIPLVERGPVHFDPYEPWLDARVNDDVARACEKAIAHNFDGLRRDVLWRIDAVLTDAGMRAEDLQFEFAAAHGELHVTITGPPTTEGCKQRLALRVADAVQAGRRNFTKKSVSYEVRTLPS